MGDVIEADKSLPRNYEVTIQNFSMIKSTMAIYKSAVFEAGGYKWKLVVYPKVNKRKKVKEHISFYLALAERVELGWEVDVVFALYLGKNSDQFPGVDFGTQKRRFHPLKLEHGLDECIDFDKLNGLEGDCCIFGAKILSIYRATTKGKAECLSMLEKPTGITYTWKIDKFSTKMNQECLVSETFKDGNIEWKMKMYQRRRKDSEGIEMSVFLEFANPTSFGYMYRIYAEVMLRIQDESKGRQATLTGKLWFSESSPEQGWIGVDKFYGAKKGFPVKDILFGGSDVLLVHANVKLLGTADAIIP